MFLSFFLSFFLFFPFFTLTSMLYSFFFFFPTIIITQKSIFMAKLPIKAVVKLYKCVNGIRRGSKIIQVSWQLSEQCLDHKKGPKLVKNYDVIILITDWLICVRKVFSWWSGHSNFIKNHDYDNFATEAPMFCKIDSTRYFPSFHGTFGICLAMCYKVCGSFVLKEFWMQGFFRNATPSAHERGKTVTFLLKQKT